MLGLDELTDASARLNAARKQREDALTAVKQRLDQCANASLNWTMSGPGPVFTRSSGRNWDIGPPRNGSRRRTMSRTAASSTLPQADATRRTSAGGRRGAAAVRSARAAACLDGGWLPAAGQARTLAGLLDAALLHQRAHGDGDCPVCGQPGALTQRWREATEEHLGRLRKEAASAEAAVAAASAAVGQALGHMQPPPAVLEQAAIAGIDLQHAREAWKQWAARPSGADLSTASGLRALADHLEHAHAPLANAVTVLSAAASRELARRDDRWAPVAADVAAWCADAGPVCEATKPVASIKQARAWLVDATSDLRNARLAPLAHQARGIWAMLRQESNVDLGAFRLAGTATQRNSSWMSASTGHRALPWG